MTKPHLHLEGEQLLRLRSTPAYNGITRLVSLYVSVCVCVCVCVSECDWV